jgi:hypothetical protein
LALPRIHLLKALKPFVRKFTFATSQGTLSRSLLNFPVFTMCLPGQFSSFLDQLQLEISNSGQEYEKGVYLQVLRGQRERHKGGRHVGKQWGEPG